MKGHHLICCLVAVCLCVACAESEREQRANTHGTCGKNLSWSVDQTGCTLTISGSGDMDDYTNSNDVPWRSYRSSIQTVVFEGNVTSVGRYAFFLCESLQSITIPESVKSISSCAFCYCPSLLSIRVEEGNTNYKDIDGVLFKKLSTKRTILLVVPGGKQGNYTIPESVEDIENHAFSQSSLTSVTIPSTLTIISGNFVFDTCRNLLSIEVDPNNPTFKSVDGVLFNRDQTTLCVFPGGKGDTYIIPDGVTEISDNAFNENNKLTSITIPSSVVYITKQSFFHCTNLGIISYLGSSDLGIESFIRSDKIRGICVPLNYDSQSFCGMKNICKREKCDELQDIENQCYQAQCKNGEWSSEKRTNATEWEKQFDICYTFQCVNGVAQSQKRENATQWEEQTNDCIEYKCDSERGLVWRSMCNSSDLVHRICIDNKCVEGKENKEKGSTVEIEIDEVKAIDLNMTEVINDIVTLTNISRDGITGGMVIDENGMVVKIILYVDSEESAMTISEKVDIKTRSKECEEVVDKRY